MMKIGTCGFCRSQEYIFKKFNVVELQNTFYDFVKDETIKKYREKAPENFEFTIKAIQIITHEKNSPTYRRFKSKNFNMDNFGNFKLNADTEMAMEKMLGYAKILKSKIIIFQSPPTFHESDENKKNVFEFFRTFKSDEITFGWETRGKWSNETLKKIFSEFDMIHVVDPFKNKPVYGKFNYFRLHGINSYSYIYNDNDLKNLKSMTKENDYVLFNNVNMCDDALRFRRIFNEIQGTGKGNTIR